MTQENNFGDYIIYVDESGDHGLISIDPKYPIFVLSFCIFELDDYVTNIAPAFNKFKRNFWGHCDVVLHEHDIRKTRKGDWSFLNDKELKDSFNVSLGQFMKMANFNVISSLVAKSDLKSTYNIPGNPYVLALQFCMERLHKWLLAKQQNNKKINIHFEARGKKEDADLELEFRRICDNKPTHLPSRTNFMDIDYSIRFMNKQSNSTGLQIADLIARPIGQHHLNPTNPNKAYDIIKPKLIYFYQAGTASPYKVFP